jgi:hypothetical protein
VVASCYIDLALRSDGVPGVLGNVELVLDHDGLGHIVEHLVGIHEFGVLLKVVELRVHSGFEGVLKLEVA